jgi:hypothetical protein
MKRKRTRTLHQVPQKRELTRAWVPFRRLGAYRGKV